MKYSSEFISGYLSFPLQPLRSVEKLFGQEGVKGYNFRKSGNTLPKKILKREFLDEMSGVEEQRDVIFQRMENLII